MNFQQTHRFNQVYKKLHRNQKADVEQAIVTILENPKIGELKKQDIAGIHVYKFRMVGQLTLLAYLVDEAAQMVTAIDLGSHENFYRDLKKSTH